MISTAQSLWKRSAEVVYDSPPDAFMGYPFARELRLGWYPSRFFFQDDCQDSFFKTLPEVEHSVVVPYHDAPDMLSHLMVVAYRPDGTLNPRRRFMVTAKGKRSRRHGGIHGIHRLRQSHSSLVVTDDETLVFKHQGVVAVGNLTANVANLIRRSTPAVNLRSENLKWVESMFPLAKHGVQVTVDGAPLAEYIATTLTQMLTDNLGLIAATHRASSLLAHLIPLERLAVLQMVKQATGVDLARALPDNFSVFKQEGEFYEAVWKELQKKITEVFLGETGLVVRSGSDQYRIPLNHHAVSALICQLMDVNLDLVEWAYRDLNEVPNFYVYREKKMQTRAEVNRHIADVIMAQLTRNARISA